MERARNETGRRREPSAGCAEATVGATAGATALARLAARAREGTGRRGRAAGWAGPIGPGRLSDSAL